MTYYIRYASPVASIFPTSAIVYTKADQQNKELVEFSKRSLGKWESLSL
jgi:hypothetical protein